MPTEEKAEEKNPVCKDDMEQIFINCHLVPTKRKKNPKKLFSDTWKQGVGEE